MVNYVDLANSLLKLTFVINIFTICGSFISFIIFSRKPFQKSSVAFYCKSLAIFDLFVLFLTGFGIAGQIINVQLIASNNNICMVIFFFSTATSPIQGWILFVFSLDQLNTVSMSHRLGFIRKRFFQFAFIISNFIFHCCLYIPVFFNVGSKSAVYNNITYFTCTSNSKALQITYLIEGTILPFVGMLITTSLIVKALIKSSQKRRASSIHPLNYAFDTRARDLKYAFNSVILNVLYILLTTPLVVFYVLTIRDFILSAILNVIFYIFFYLNFALHFWVYLILNSYFRNELLVMLRLREKRQSLIIRTTTCNNYQNKESQF